MRSAAASRSGVYGPGPLAFQRLLKAWRDDGRFEGLETNGAHARVNKEQIGEQTA